MVSIVDYDVQGAGLYVLAESTVKQIIWKDSPHQPRPVAVSLGDIALDIPFPAALDAARVVHVELAVYDPPRFGYRGGEVAAGDGPGAIAAELWGVGFWGGREEVAVGGGGEVPGGAGPCVAIRSVADHGLSVGEISHRVRAANGHAACREDRCGLGEACRAHEREGRGGEE